MVNGNKKRELKMILEEIVNHYIYGIPFSDVLGLISDLYGSGDETLKKLASLIEHEPKGATKEYRSNIIQMAKQQIKRLA